MAELAAGADVVVEDRRPGEMARRSLGYVDVTAGNDDVVYCSISAYGQEGSRRDRVGYDAAVAAHLGIVNEWGGSREGPIFLGHPAIDYSTALLAADRHPRLRAQPDRHRAPATTSTCRCSTGRWRCTR